MTQEEKHPFLQGDIDLFCAAYAVINALRKLYNVQLLEGRHLLRDALLDAAQNLDFFQDLLDQKTDYVSWVDSMLDVQCRKGLLRVEKPFYNAPLPAKCYETTNLKPADLAAIPATIRPMPAPEAVWKKMFTWLHDNPQHCLVFQFVRFLLLKDNFLLIRHWTCCGEVENSALVFYDCSRDRTGMYRLSEAQIITDERDGSAEKVLVPPHTIRCLEKTM